jgi:hypothetical protein
VNPFDSIQLEPISEPIPPEAESSSSPLAWVMVVTGSLLVVLGIVLLIRGRRFIFRQRPDGPLHDRQIRRLLRELRKAEGVLSVEEVNAAWQLVEARLRSLGVTMPPQPSLDEVAAAFAASEVFDTSTIQLMHLIIQQVERLKYEGRAMENGDIELRIQLCKLLEQLLVAKQNPAPR